MTLNGVDIINWQSGINLITVPADFVIIKATARNTYVSPEAYTKKQGAKSAGRMLGVDHFAKEIGACL